MNHVALMLYLLKSFKRRGTPTSPAYIPYNPQARVVNSSPWIQYPHSKHVPEKHHMANSPLPVNLSCMQVVSFRYSMLSSLCFLPSRRCIDINAEAYENLARHIVQCSGEDNDRCSRERLYHTDHVLICLLGGAYGRHGAPYAENSMWIPGRWNSRR